MGNYDQYKDKNVNVNFCGTQHYGLTVHSVDEDKDIGLYYLNVIVHPQQNHMLIPLGPMTAIEILNG
jgi:hypothetical protein